MKLINNFRIYKIVDNITEIDSIVNSEQQVIFLAKHFEEENIEYRVIKHNFETNTDFPCTLEIKEKVKKLGGQL